MGVNIGPSTRSGYFIGGSQIPRNGLKLWYDMANYDSYPSTGTTWYDISGNGNDGTISNSNAGSLNNHMDFDGTSDYVEITDTTFGDTLAGDITTALSIVCWAETDTSLSGEKVLCRKENQWQLGFDGNTQVRNLIRTSGGTTGWTASNDDNHNGITTNKWYMWSFTWNGSTLTNYQNTDSIGTHTVTGTLATAYHTNHLFIGAKSPGSTLEWNGGLDIFLIYNVALSASQIHQIYNVYRGRFDV